VGTAPEPQLVAQAPTEGRHRRCSSDSSPSSTRRNTSPLDQPGDQHERHHAGGPAERHQGVAVQRDDGLRERERRACRMALPKASTARVRR
jgi:hypothetical protein